MAVIEVESLDDLNEILGRSDDVVVEFGASWCAPCRAFRPHFEKFAEKTGVVSVYCTIEYDVAISEKYEIRSVPQVFHFRNGEISRPLEARTVALLEKEYISAP